LSGSQKIELAEERRGSEDPAQKGSMLKLLRYEHGNTEIAREHVQQIDEGGHIFEIENVVEEKLETKHRTVKRNRCWINK